MRESMIHALQLHDLCNTLELLSVLECIFLSINMIGESEWEGSHGLLSCYHTSRKKVFCS